MFSPPFQYLTAHNLGDVAGCFLMAWLFVGFFLGLPCLMAVALGSYVVRRYKLYQIRLFKLVSFRTVAMTLPVAGFLFGAATGWFNAWVDHREAVTQTMVPTRYLVAVVPGLPGDAMANTYGGDWQADEEWDYRSDIMIWNGLFWTTVAAAGVLMLHWFRRWATGKDEAATAPASAFLMSPR